jgi:hypothetical protein
LLKSAETIENKGVEFLLHAKKCKRVRKSIKTKEMDAEHKKFERSEGRKFEDTPLPPAFCMNVKIKELQKLHFVSD